VRAEDLLSPAISMVIRTEYGGHRYSTATSCASPTAPSFTRGGRPGQGRFPPRSLLTPRRSPKRTMRAPQRHDADDAPASALDRRGWNDVGPRASPLNAMRLLARWRPLLRGNAWFPNHSSPTACATPQWRMPRRPAPTWRRARAIPAATSQRLGTRRHHRRRVVPRLHQRATACHFARVRGVGFSGVPDPVMF
jgi:hypothetical protein